MTDNHASHDKRNSESNRRTILQMAGLGLAAFGAGIAPATPVRAQYAGVWDKKFAKSNKVAHRKVSYTNRVGINLVADLYVPRGTNTARVRPALVVGHPFGGVKEQTSGLYAQTMAERGFVTLAFDASFNGESGGQPHFIASPDIFVEDFLAGVDFLGTHALVDRQRVGVIGVCASGAFALAAAEIDPRIKAVATVSMYDMGGAKFAWDGKPLSPKDREAVLRAATEQRWIEFAGGQPRYGALPETLAADADPITREFFDYYRTPRGAHPRSTTSISLTSDPSFFHFRPFDHLDAISPRPVLLVAGEKAHSLFFSKQAIEKAAAPKELFLVAGAGHVDLYDRVDLIPFDKLQSFFSQHLA